MQRTERMTLDGMIGAAASGLVGWLAASVTKVGKADHKELMTRVDAIEKDLSSRMTRAEFDHAFGKVESQLQAFRLEVRADFKDLKSELKTKM